MAKTSLKNPEMYSDWAFSPEKHGIEEVVEDDHGADEEETDWVAEVESRSARKEVAMTDLLKSAKQRKAKKKVQMDDGFQVVSDSAQSVIVLNDQPTREVEEYEPWEFVEFEDEGGGKRAFPATSYAKIVENAARGIVTTGRIFKLHALEEI